MTRTALLRSLAVVGLLALAGCGGGNSTGSDRAGATSEVEGAAWHGGILTDPQPRPSFTLTDTSGAPYDFAAQTSGRLTLLFFGYTSCPDVCPIHMATLSAALEQPNMPHPVVVFVTTDPARDTPAKLRDWLDNFGTDFVGLTGTADQIAAAEQAAGVAPSVPLAPDGSPASTTAPGDYQVGHAAEIIAYSPDDLAYMVYPSGVQRTDWQADLPRLADGEAPSTS
jgi:protein SCO1/2